MVVEDLMPSGSFVTKKKKILEPKRMIEDEALKLLEEIEHHVLEARSKLYDLFALKKRMVKDYEKRKDSSGADAQGDTAKVDGGRDSPDAK